VKPENFAYWLQGYFELTDGKTLNAKQVTVIKNHLALVFEHVIDPSYTSHLPAEDAKKVQSDLQAIHDAGPVTHPAKELKEPSGWKPGFNHDTVYRC